MWMLNDGGFEEGFAMCPADSNNIIEPLDGNLLSDSGTNLQMNDSVVAFSDFTSFIEPQSMVETYKGTEFFAPMSSGQTASFADQQLATPFADQTPDLSNAGEPPVNRDGEPRRLFDEMSDATTGTVRERVRFGSALSDCEYKCRVADSNVRDKAGKVDFRESCLKQAIRQYENASPDCAYRYRSTVELAEKWLSDAKKDLADAQNRAREAREELARLR